MAIKKDRKRRKKKTMAKQADKFMLYQQSVQNADHEVEFFEQAFREQYNRKPYTLREDFCGTYAVCCEWVKSSSRRTAIAVDLCSETLVWGTKHNLGKLKKSQQKRVTVLEQDVREKNKPKVDVLAAQNFSFWIFKTRKEVINYFKIARANMNDEAIFVMDMMGGGACQTEDHTDKRTIIKGKRGFKYHWEQARFDPVTSDCSFYINFSFPDGSKLKHAFEYHWRFWTIPEVREMLSEAGFSASHVYWEQEDENGEDTGEWARCESAASQASWIAYIVATA
ncbi:MAG: hypothetical protein KDB27_33075 [Planctomycetales bacterium]|nr:hypothetical protein [Planctomycetales bacterium]